MARDVRGRSRLHELRISFWTVRGLPCKQPILPVITFRKLCNETFRLYYFSKCVKDQPFLCRCWYSQGRALLSSRTAISFLNLVGRTLPEKSIFSPFDYSNNSLFLWNRTSVRFRRNALALFQVQSRLLSGDSDENHEREEKRQSISHRRNPFLASVTWGRMLTTRP